MFINVLQLAKIYNILPVKSSDSQILSFMKSQNLAVTRFFANLSTIRSDIFFKLSNWQGFLFWYDYFMIRVFTILCVLTQK